MPRPAATKPVFGEDGSFLLRSKRYRYVRGRLVVLS